MTISDRKVKKTLTLFTFWFGAKRRHCGPNCYGDRDERFGGTATRLCRCICLGTNHGLGRAAAIAESKTQVMDLIAHYKPTRHWICDEVRQLDLPYDEQDQQQ